MTHAQAHDEPDQPCPHCGALDVDRDRWCNHNLDAVIRRGDMKAHRPCFTFRRLNQSPAVAGFTHCGGGERFRRGGMEPEGEGDPARLAGAPGSGGRRGQSSAS